MSSAPSPSVVFDCPVFAQALINPRGPAAACLTHAQHGRVILFVSDYVLQEIRELPPKVKPALGVTSDRVSALIADLGKYARFVEDIPDLYRHPVDADDSHYINLALKTGAQLIVTRDRHLLDLMDPQQDAARDFVSRFPELRIIDPPTLLHQLTK